MIPDELKPTIELLAKMAVTVVRTPILKTPADYAMNFVTKEFFSEDGVSVKAWYIPANNSNKLVLVSHPMPMNRYGYPGHLDEFKALFPDEVNFINTYKHLVDAGFNVLAFDLRNHGESGEANNGICGIGMHEYKDVIAAMNFVCVNPEFAEQEVRLLGHCTAANAMFKAMALEPALFARVRSMVAVQPCTMSYLVESFATMYGVDSYMEAIDEEIVKLGGISSKAMSPYDFVPNISIPTLLAQVRNDAWTKNIDIKTTYALLGASVKDLHWIEGTNRRFDGYNYFGSSPEKLIEWFRNY